MNFYLEKMKTDSTFKGAYGGSIAYFLYTNQINSKSMQNKFCPDAFLTIPVVIYTSKDFFLLEALNEEIQLLKSAGLINFWHYQKYIDTKILKMKQSKSPKVLTMRHFEGCFGILMLGNLIGFLVFLIEFFMSNRKAK